MRSALLALLLSLIGAPAYAQSARDGGGHYGHGHAENHDWYKDLKRPGTNYSCCNGSMNGVDGDCRPTRAYLGDDGVWRALINGRWVNVPPKTVLRDLAPDGRSHVCVSPIGIIHCFLGGSPKS